MQSMRPMSALHPANLPEPAPPATIVGNLAP